VKEKKKSEAKPFIINKKMAGSQLAGGIHCEALRVWQSPNTEVTASSLLYPVFVRYFWRKLTQHKEEGKRRKKRERLL
jgi:hypothetical protein